MIKLGNCPFCGGITSAKVDYNDRSFHIFCEECPAEMVLSFADAELGDGDVISFDEMTANITYLCNAWNKRAKG